MTVPEREQHVPEGDRVVNDRGRASTLGHRVPLLSVVVLLVLATTACGGTGRGDTPAADASARQEAGGREGAPATETTASARERGDRTGKADARSGHAAGGADGGATRPERVGAGTGKAGAQVGEARADAGSVAIAGSREGIASESRSQKVTLKVTGDWGARFTGACSVGGTERSLEGRTPERYAFEPRGEGLECELRSKDEGTLGIVLTDGAGVRSEQQITGGESTARFTYSNGGVSSSTLSVSEGRTVTSSDGPS